MEFRFRFVAILFELECISTSLSAEELRTFEYRIEGVFEFISLSLSAEALRGGARFFSLIG